MRFVKLFEHIEAARNKTFEYGVHDCALFAADWVAECTGVDPAADLRGYSGKEAADEIISSYGSLEALITDRLGEPIPVAWASRGDIVIATLPTPEGEADCVGICAGASSAFASHVGVRMIPTSRARLAWRVG